MPSLFSRWRKRFGEIAKRFLPPLKPPTPPTPPPPPPSPPAPPLPPGPPPADAPWGIEGIHTRDHRYIEGDTFTDDEIGHALAIVIWIEAPDGTRVHRTIHGAIDNDQIADLVARVVKVVSPPKRAKGAYR